MGDPPMDIHAFVTMQGELVRKRRRERDTLVVILGDLWAVAAPAISAEEFRQLLVERYDSEEVALIWDRLSPMTGHFYPNGTWSYIYDQCPTCSPLTGDPLLCPDPWHQR